MLAATAMISTPVHAATITIKVGVATAFASAASDIAAAFSNYYLKNYNLSYNVVITFASTPTLETAIINGGNSGPYDLFLAADREAPHDLANNYASLVEGSPFPYAQDFLELYSTSVDISQGLPYPLTTNFVVPDPTKDNYGAAAAEVLSTAPWYITTIPGGYVSTLPSVGAAYAAAKKGTFAYGFVAKSQICKYINGAETYPTGSYHHEYHPHSYLHPYEKLKLKGIKIALSARTTDQETELTNFVNFLTGNVTTAGTDIIQSYCFKLPQN